MSRINYITIKLHSKIHARSGGISIHPPPPEKISLNNFIVIYHVFLSRKVYRKQQRKATEKPDCYQKVIIYFASLFSLPIAAQFLRCRGTFSLVSAVRFWNGQGVLSIDYSGAKYARFTPKIAAVLKSLF